MRKGALRKPWCCRYNHLFVLSVCLFVLLWAGDVWAAASVRTTSLALLIGNNDGGRRTKALQFAESDARKMKHVLLEASGARKRNIWLARGVSDIALRRIMKKIKTRIQRIRKKRGTQHNITLLVYYSGHARKGQLLLGRSTFSFRELRSFLRASGADVRLAIIDACESGRLTTLKGLRHRNKTFPIPMLHISPTIKGEVLISATGAKESAHEDPELRGGVFTHYLVSGLRGAADRNGDGYVTLEEIYRYAYLRSLERTILSVHGPQRAHFRKSLSGYGRLVLTSLSRPRSWLLLRAGVAGDFFVWDRAKSVLLAELNKSKGRAGVIALSPGRYVLQWRRKGGIFSSKISLRRGQKLRLRMIGRRVAYWKKGTIRGTTSSSEAGLWVPFEGQQEGFSFGVHYRLGVGQLSQGMLTQGVGLTFRFPLESIGWDAMHVGIRLAYQYGTSQLSSTFGYTAHILPVDVSLGWRLWHGRWGELSLGPRLRFAPLLQSLEQPPNKDEQILSMMYEAGGMLQWQLHLTSTWFVRLDIDGGVRLFDLGGDWVARGVASFSLGGGWRW
ncbi:MAG TPA: hypothetical protein DCE42_21980 [Myxococcales bacterium]|nr:hypothetical protein [Myxococcales bacterium]